MLIPQQRNAPALPCRKTIKELSWELMAEMEKAGAARLNAAKLERLTKEAFTFKEGQGAGCPEPMVSRALLGKDAPVLAKAAGVNVPDKTELLFAETEKDRLFVKEEQM